MFIITYKLYKQKWTHKIKKQNYLDPILLIQCKTFADKNCQLWRVYVQKMCPFVKIEWSFKNSNCIILLSNK